MTLSGLDRPSAKPRGGIASVELVAASGFVDAEYDAVRNCYTRIWASEPFAAYIFREDRASYIEEAICDGGRVLFSHTLSMEFTPGPQTRGSVTQLMSLAADGVVAIVTTGAGERLLGGYSPRFGTRFPLRPVNMASDVGTRPSDYPAQRLIFRCEDTALSIPLTE